MKNKYTFRVQVIDKDLRKEFQWDETAQKALDIEVVVGAGSYISAMPEVRRVVRHLLAERGALRDAKEIKRVAVIELKRIEAEQ